MLFINSCYSAIHVIHQMLFINSCYSANVIHQFNVFQLIACKHVLLKLFRRLDFNTNHAKKFNCLTLIRFSYNNPYRKPYYVTYSGISSSLKLGWGGGKSGASVLDPL